MNAFVQLDSIAGFTASTLAAAAVSADGRKAYLGRAASYDPEMRNFVVAPLAADGSTFGVPQSYAASAWALDPITGQSPQAGTNATITAILANRTRTRLYIAEARTSSQPTKSGLNVFTLDAQGNPVGAVRTYPNGNTVGGVLMDLVLHPKLPLLYTVGWGMAGVAVQQLDAEGEPSGNPAVHGFGGQGKYTVGVSPDGRFLYLGSFPDLLEVIALDAQGNPTGTGQTYTVSNPDVGTVGDYLRFAKGARALYMIRPGLGGQPAFLAFWPLDAATGQPLGKARAQ